MLGAQWSWSSYAARRGLLALLGLGMLGGAALVAASEASAGATPRHAAPRPSPAPQPAASAPSPESSAGTAAPSLEPITIRPAAHPLDGVPAAQIDALLRKNPERLGSASVGRPNRGRLMNGVRLEPGGGIDVVDPGHAYGTELSVRSIQTAVAEVVRDFPDSPTLFVGDLSRNTGGYLRPHRSHQTGLDADVGYYYREPVRWYTKANAKNLDRTRTLALLKALITQGNVEYVFMDRAVQALLREHAAAEGAPPELLDTLFEGRTRRRALVRHAPRHLTHFHVRFADPVAEETGRRVLPALQRRGRL